MHHANRLGSDRGGSVSGSGIKRPVEKVAGDGFQGAVPEEKRQKLPALASVVIEAVKMDSLQKLCSSLEPILRRVVREEVECALARLVPNRLGLRNPPRQIQESHSSEMRLIFRDKLALPLFTGGKVEGELGVPIHVVLEDGSTGQVVTAGPGSTAKLEVVVLDGDFANDDDQWTAEDFENHVVKERDGKRPLLTGELFITLKEGVGTLGELTFTDNSSWIRSRKFKLGLRVVSGGCEGTRIHECKTDAFTVKDHRGELYKKHYPPAVNDEVWRLDKVGKDGAFHKRLNLNGIKTVEDFLRCYVMDQQKLRNTLGNGMSNKMWEATVEHAKTCVLSGKLYVLHTDRLGVIFNNIYELMGVTSNGHYISAESLTEKDKVYVDNVVKVSYENRASFTEYDSAALASKNTYKPAVMHGENESSRTAGSWSGLKEQSLMYSQPVVVPQQLRHFQSTSTVIHTPASGVTPQLYDHNAETSITYANQDQLTQSNQMFSTGNGPLNQSSSNMPLQGSFPEASVTSLALGPPQSRVSKSFGYQSVPPSQQIFQAGSVEWPHIRVQDPMTPAVDHYFTEEDIRANNSELIGSEDMQQLLSLQYLPGNYQLQGEDAYYSEFTSSDAVSYGENVVRSSGKAVVGWLKLKAALRWGIFIRKIAAKNAVKRRAQLEELED